MKIKALTATAALLASAGVGVSGGAAWAHHSFAVFFDETKDVRIEGVVTAFRFTNPHGTIALDVRGPDGATQHWRVETNAPVVLQRRGWSRDSLHAGERVRIDGWPARDGSQYMRLRAAATPEGQPIGRPFILREDG